MMKELVSIIIPAFNSEGFIEACIDSVRNQSYSNIEVILINDGSTDRTLDIMNAYAKNDIRFRVYTKINSGISSTRNLGIDLVRGNYTIFIDSDDVVHEDYIKLLINNALNESSDVTICDYYLVKNKQHSLITYGMSFDKNTYINELLLHNVWGVLWNKLIKTSLFRDNKIRFPVGINMWEDLYFCVCILMNSKKTSILNIPLYYYMVRNESLVNSNISFKRVDDQIEVISLLSSVDGINKYISLDTSKLRAKGALITNNELFNARKWCSILPVGISGVIKSNVSFKHKSIALLVLLKLSWVAKKIISFSC